MTYYIYSIVFIDFFINIFSLEDTWVYLSTDLVD